MPARTTAASFLWEYLRCLVREWFTIAIGALLVVDVYVLRAQGHEIAGSWLLGAPALAYVVVSFRAWLGERRRAIRAEAARPPA
jgi:hypothetical protein